MGVSSQPPLQPTLDTATVTTSEVSTTSGSGGGGSESQSMGTATLLEVVSSLGSSATFYADLINAAVLHVPCAELYTAMGV